MDFSSEEIVTIVNSTRDGSIWDMLAITLVSAEKDRVVATMPIGPQHRQQVGYLHGGVSVVLAGDGQLTAVATPVHRGRTTHVWDIRINDENDKLVCVSRCTVAVVDRPPDSDSPFSRNMPSFG